MVVFRLIYLHSDPPAVVLVLVSAFLTGHTGLTYSFVEICPSFNLILR